LIKERGIWFEDIVECIATGGILDIVDHHDSINYPYQKKMIIIYHDYIYYVPYVMQDDGSLFLKTIIPSRTHTKTYLSS